MMRSIPTCTLLVVLAAGCASDARQGAVAAQQAADLPFEVRVVADFESPWAMTFLPDGRMLITEKAGTLGALLGAIHGARICEVEGLPVDEYDGMLRELMPVVGAEVTHLTDRIRSERYDGTQAALRTYAAAAARLAISGRWASASAGPRSARTARSGCWKTVGGAAPVGS